MELTEPETVSTVGESGRIRIVPHGPEFRCAVAAFNQRMRAGGSFWGFYIDPECDWIPWRRGRRVWREHYLAIEADGTVRGGFTLKPQPWYIAGRLHRVADWQGPFGEGEIDPRFAALGFRMIREMLRRQPMLYSWGHGGNEKPIVELLRRMHWLVHDTPFLLYVHRPRRFLRYNQYLRQTAPRRVALDLLAHSGAGWIGLRALQGALAATGRVKAREWHAPKVAAEVVDSFGPWADALWMRVKDHYTALAVRDADVMNTLLPRNGWPKAIRLQIKRGQEVIGWVAVLDTQMSGDARFGTLRVGSCIDALSLPEDAPAVVHAAKTYLCKRGVDIIVSNQAHPMWIAGFQRNGFVALENRRLFACSPPLAKQLSPFEEVKRGLHLTNLDGHGPHLL